MIHFDRRELLVKGDQCETSCSDLKGKMDMTNPARQVKLSLTLIIIFAFASGLDFAFGLDFWDNGDAKYLLNGVITVLFLGIAVFHAWNVSRLIHKRAPE
jgi:hypothetical protein